MRIRQKGRQFPRQRFQHSVVVYWSKRQKTRRSIDSDSLEYRFDDTSRENAHLFRPTKPHSSMQNVVVLLGDSLKQPLINRDHDPKSRTAVFVHKMGKLLRRFVVLTRTLRFKLEKRRQSRLL